MHEASRMPFTKGQLMGKLSRVGLPIVVEGLEGTSVPDPVFGATGTAQWSKWPGLRQVTRPVAHPMPVT